MAVLHENKERLATGAPMPKPVWQMLCEFANGHCVCANTSGIGRPCQAVETAAARIRNRVQIDLANERRAWRGSKP